MRKYTRKKISLKDVSTKAEGVAKHVLTNDIDEQAKRLIASGWTSRAGLAERARDVNDDGIEAAFTYTGYVPMPKPKKMRDEHERTVIVVKHKRGERERIGKLFIHGKFAD